MYVLKVFDTKDDYRKGKPSKEQSYKAKIVDGDIEAESLFQILEEAKNLETGYNLVTIDALFIGRDYLYDSPQRIYMSASSAEGSSFNRKEAFISPSFSNQISKELKNSVSQEFLNPRKYEVRIYESYESYLDNKSLPYIRCRAKIFLDAVNYASAVAFEGSMMFGQVVDEDTSEELYHFKQGTKEDTINHSDYFQCVVYQDVDSDFSAETISTAEELYCIPVNNLVELKDAERVSIDLNSKFSQSYLSSCQLSDIASDFAELAETIQGNGFKAFAYAVEGAELNVVGVSGKGIKMSFARSFSITCRYALGKVLKAIDKFGFGKDLFESYTIFGDKDNNISLVFKTVKGVEKRITWLSKDAYKRVKTDFAKGELTASSTDLADLWVKISAVILLISDRTYSEIESITFSKSTFNRTGGFKQFDVAPSGKELRITF